VSGGQRGTCAACRVVVALNLDGTARKHGACPGSGRPEAEALFGPPAAPKPQPHPRKEAQLRRRAGLS